MQRNTSLRALAVSIALAAHPAAAAVHVSPDGQGQVLLFPYYTVNANNNTMISLANHTAEVKAVKVRFREAMNGREVLDFNLYLAPFASWRAMLRSPGESDPAWLFTPDRACTVPSIPEAGVPFRNHFYTGSQDDDGPNQLDRTREGFVEVIEMGVVVDDGDDEGPRFPLPDAPGNRAGTDNTVEHSGRHFAHDASLVDGVPRNCAALYQAWRDGAWDSKPDVDLDEPSGGLAGSFAIVDVEDGVAYSQRAEALDGFFTVADSAELHTTPGSVFPDLAAARTRASGAVESMVAGQILHWTPATPQAVSSVLMHRQAFNDFSSSAALLGASEWVLTFPTKNLHGRYGSPDVLARRPFADLADDHPENSTIPGNITDTSVFDPEGSCENIDLAFHRPSGERLTPAICYFDPCPEPESPPPTRLCHQANVVAWNQAAAVEAGATEIFGARRVASNHEIYVYDGSGGRLESGQIALSLGDESNFMIADPVSPAGTVRDRLFGLPAIGFWAGRFVNADAQPGVLASYALLVPHAWGSERDRVTVTDETAPGGISPVPEQ